MGPGAWPLKSDVHEGYLALRGAVVPDIQGAQGLEAHQEQGERWHDITPVVVLEIREKIGRRSDSSRLSRLVEGWQQLCHRSPLDQTGES